MQPEPLPPPQRARGRPPVFAGAQFVARELQPEQIPALQALFEANPDYFVTVNGRGPEPDEAQREFDELPPAHLSYGARWFTGIFDPADTLRGVVILVSDLAARGVWHTALFFLEGSLHGTGAAQAVYTSMEAHARASGAQWMRLGVVEGNLRAERFWSRCGYTAVRTRTLVNGSGEVKMTRVMVKPLAGGSLVDYLHRVPRDAPDSPAP